MKKVNKHKLIIIISAVMALATILFSLKITYDNKLKSEEENFKKEIASIYALKEDEQVFNLGATEKFLRDKNLCFRDRLFSDKYINCVSSVLKTNIEYMKLISDKIYNREINKNLTKKQTKYMKIMSKEVPDMVLSWIYYSGEYCKEISSQNGEYKKDVDFLCMLDNSYKHIDKLQEIDKFILGYK